MFLCPWAPANIGSAKGLLDYYEMAGQKTQPGRADENGNIEQRHHRCSAPCNASFGIDPLEVPNQQQPEIEPVWFALVEGNAPVTTDNLALELVLASGDRLRIATGVDAATLRNVLKVLRDQA